MHFILMSVAMETEINWITDLETFQLSRILAWQSMLGVR